MFDFVSRISMSSNSDSPRLQNIEIAQIAGRQVMLKNLSTQEVNFIQLSKEVGKITAICTQSSNDRVFLAVAGSKLNDDSKLWFSTYDLSIKGNRYPALNDMVEIDLQPDDSQDSVSPIPEEGDGVEKSGGRVCAFPHKKVSTSGQNFS